MSVTTIRRVEHRWTIVEQENARRAAAGQPPLTDPEIAALFGPDERDSHPERFIRTVEYSDGFGRLLQTRTQADDLVVDDLGLADDPAAPAGPVIAHLAAADSPPVVVSGWTIYDNKGRPTIGYEPFVGTGYSYQPPSDQHLATLARTARHYDPRGLCIRTVAPDGSETVTVPGHSRHPSRPRRGCADPVGDLHLRRQRQRRPDSPHRQPPVRRPLEHPRQHRARRLRPYRQRRRPHCRRDAGHRHQLRHRRPPAHRHRPPRPAMRGHRLRPGRPGLAQLAARRRHHPHHPRRHRRPGRAARRQSRHHLGRL